MTQIDRRTLCITLKLTAVSILISVAVSSAIQHYAGAELGWVHFSLAFGMPVLLTPAVAVPLIRTNLQLRRVRFELERLAHSDPLTGLPNRRAFFDRAGDMFKAGDAMRPGVMMIDIDRFKAVNDRFGHDGGDAYLRAVAASLAGLVMPACADGDRVLARIGGEEFAAVIGSCDERSIVALAEAICEHVRGFVCHHLGVEISATVSIGVALHQPGESLDATLRRADLAVYAAKHEGRDCWRLAPAGADSTRTPMAPRREAGRPATPARAA